MPALELHDQSTTDLIFPELLFPKKNKPGNGFLFACNTLTDHFEHSVDGVPPMTEIRCSEAI